MRTFVPRSIGFMAAIISVLTVLAVGTAAADAGTVAGPAQGTVTVGQLVKTAAVAVTRDPVSNPAPVRYSYQARTTPATCTTGYVCAFVQAPGVDRFKKFEFYNYGTYTLSWWYNTGAYFNDQTGGAIARNVNCNGTHRDYAVNTRTPYTVDWAPVCKIQLVSP